MDMDVDTIIWYFIAAVSASVPIYFIKKYSQSNDFYWIVLSVISYLLLIYSYTIILKDKNITIVYPIVKVVSIILVVFYGIAFIGNTIDIHSGVGILCGLISIYLLSQKTTSGK